MDDLELMLLIEKCAEEGKSPKRFRKELEALGVDTARVPNLIRLCIQAAKEHVEEIDPDGEMRRKS